MSLLPDLGQTHLADDVGRVLCLTIPRFQGIRPLFGGTFAAERLLLLLFSDYVTLTGQ